MQKIHKGDQVEIIAGKDRGKRGKVLAVFAENDRVVVEGANIVTRHRRKQKDGTKGERIEAEGAFHVSNVMLVCPHTGKPTRVGFRVEGGEKVRVSKKSGKVIA
jgi:large subunit ribosomal protein L24